MNALHLFVAKMTAANRDQVWRVWGVSLALFCSVEINLLAAVPDKGNLQAQEYGDAAYRQLGWFWLAGLDYNHTGIYAGMTSGETKRVMQATHVGLLTDEYNFTEQFTDYGSNYFGTYTVSNTTLSFSKRKSIVATASELAAAHISYTLFDAIGYTSTPVTKTKITDLRCDGFVEFCYESNGVQVWRDTTHASTQWSIVDYPENHNNAPGTLIVSPSYELSPWAQRGSPRGTGPLYVGADLVPDNTYMTRASVINLPTYQVTQVQGNGYTDVTVQATDESGIHYIGYKKPGDFSWSYSSKQAQHPTSASYSYTVRVVSSGTFYAFAMDNGGNYPATVSGYTVTVVSAPSAPTGVSATDGTYTDKVKVTWNSVSGATSYELWRNTSNNFGSATQLGTGITGTSFDNTSAVAGTTYYYWVKAVNSGGGSGFSASDSGYRATAVSPPSAPTGVNATDGTYTDKVAVTWNSVSGATSYELWRNTSNNSGSATQLGTGITGTSFDNTSAVAGTTYYYWVKAVNSGGTSGFSASDSGYRAIVSTPVINVTPTSLSFSAVAGGGGPLGQSINITNSGGGTLNWSAAVTSGSFINLVPGTTTGTNTGSVSVFADVGALNPSTYNGNIRISASGASNTPVDIPVTFTISPAPATTINPTSRTSPAAGETYSIAVTSNTSWTAGSDQAWATLSPASGLNNRTVAVAVAPNTSTSSRSATITIGGQTHILTQDGVTTSSELPYDTKRAIATGVFSGQMAASTQDGGLAIFGSFSGTLTTGGQTLTSAGSSDFFAVKLNASGQAVWVKRYGGTSEETVEACVQHPSGGWVISGTFTGTSTLGSTTLTSTGDRDAFLARLDEAGNVLWARRAGGSSTDYGKKAAVDGSGNCFLAGVFITSATVSGSATTLSASGTAFDVFVAKYSSDGVFQWAKSAGGSHYDDVYCAAADANGNVYIGGIFEQQATYGSYTLTVAGNSAVWDAYLTKFGPNGDVVWAKRFGEPAGGFSIDTLDFISAGTDGSCFFGGSYWGPMSVEGKELAAQGMTTAFVGKVSPTGSLAWLKAFVATATAETSYTHVSFAERGLSMSDGGILVGGRYRGQIAFGASTISASTGSPTTDLYFARFDASGAPLWAVAATNSGYDDYLLYLGAAANEQVWFLANIGGGTTNLPSLGSVAVAGGNLFLVELGPKIATAPVISSGLTASVYVGGAFTYTITASNAPTVFNAIGLPPGLSINTATGVISGTPATMGTYPVSLSATNAAGTGTAALTLTVRAGWGDLNGDGQSDLLWQNSGAGQIGMWQMNGTSQAGNFVNLVALGSDGFVAGVADFDGDGKNDLLVRNRRTGEVGFWLLDGTTPKGAYLPIDTVPLDWQIAGADDFNGDGKVDVVWQNTVDGRRGVWLMNGTSHDGNYQALPTIPPEWTISAVADFNADGKPDLLWTDTQSGVRGFWLMDGLAQVGDFVFLSQVPPEWTIAQTGDFNGDGKTDIVWSNITNGVRGFWLMNGTAPQSDFLQLAVIPPEWRLGGLGQPGVRPPQITTQPESQSVQTGRGFTLTVSATGATSLSYQWSKDGLALTGATGPTLTVAHATIQDAGQYTGTVTDQAGTSVTSSAAIVRVIALGDINGDGQSDLLWQYPATGLIGTWLMSGTNPAGDFVNLVGLGPDGFVAGVADFNRDGKNDLLVRNRRTGEVGFWLLDGVTPKGAYLPIDTIPLDWQVAGVGDFNADGKVDVVWQNTVDGRRGVWLMNGTAHDGNYQAMTVIPTEWTISAVADFNADGKPDLLWTNTQGGVRGFWLMDGLAQVGDFVFLSQVPPEWVIAQTGDFNGDGKTDIVWSNLTTGVRGFWLMNRTTPQGDFLQLAIIPPEWRLGILKSPE